MQTEIYYRKVMNDLRRRIVNGDYARGEFIPSEERLQAEYGVSRTTVRTAVKELVDEGLLQIVRGKGTRVCFPLCTPCRRACSASARRCAPGA